MKMKHYFILTFLLVFSSLCFAQTPLTEAQLSKLTKPERALYERIKTADSLRTLRINNFFNVNTQMRKVLVENGKTYVVYDVVDNQPIYRTLDNLDAARSTGTNHLQVGGSLGLDLDGTGMTVGVWDGGPIQDTHVEFQDGSGNNTRIANLELTNTDGSMDQDAHATHVSGTIAAKGVLAAAKGMATNVNLRTYNFNNDVFEIVLEKSSSGIPMYFSNHSYGIPVSQNGGTLPAWRMGAYDSGAREIDDIASTYPEYLIVMSAGNSGATSYTGGLFDGYDKLTSDKNAKNNLVVANADPSIDFFTNQLTLNINLSSSQGPTDDLRIKPDIAGDGTNLRSPVPNDNYAVFSGTSMAAPNVTGSLVLLQEYYNQLHGDFMMAATIKGLVCHTAVDDAFFIGPDPIYGWGLLNARDAAEVITADDNGSGGLIQELSLNNGDSYDFTFTAEAGTKVKATICWTDVPGESVSGESNLNNPSPRLINDLDLRISKDGVTYLPWKLDYDSTFGFSNSKGDNIVDNIEVVEIDVPTTGTYNLSVTHKGNLRGTTPFSPALQDFSLILTGENLTLSTGDLMAAEGFQIYPNPNNGNFTLGFDYRLNDTNMEIEIYDLRGRLIAREQIDSAGGNNFKKEMHLDSSVKSGVYIINISTNTGKISRKLIVN